MPAVPDWLKYANFGAVRDDPLSPELIAMLEQVLPELGLGLDVFSGGQSASGPDRTGSHRHDYGNAADVFFTKDGRRLDWANPDDLPLISQAITQGRKAGITGWGAGEGYMQPGSVHLGLGTPATWGAGGKSENAPDWLVQAVADGTADAKLAEAGYTPEQRRDAIASIESQGSGDYGALGAYTGDPEEGRDRAYGRYQVMGANIPVWAEQYLKKSGVTPEMFLKDPQLQDELFDAVYGDYVKQYGERGAASKWFTGSEKEPIRSDAHGALTGRSYADEYMAALEGSAGHVRHSPNPTVGTGGFVAPGADTTPVPADKAPPKIDLAKNYDKWDEAFASGIGDIGGGEAGQLPIKSNVPQGALRGMPLPPVAAGDTSAGDQLRQQLAAAVARLNSGKLFG